MGFGPNWFAQICCSSSNHNCHCSSTFDTCHLQVCSCTCPPPYCTCPHHCHTCQNCCHHTCSYCTCPPYCTCTCQHLSTPARTVVTTPTVVASAPVNTFGLADGNTGFFTFPG